jgi:glycosyltransferase involved in cell wall biosynthesis
METENPSTIRKAPSLALIAPCFNEEAVLGMTIPRLCGRLRELEDNGKIAKGSFVLLVDDGSRDSTWRIISEAHARDPAIRGLKLSRNFGHQAALCAGLSWCTHRCDCAISIDADLQQDDAAIAAFIDEYRRGSEIVYGVRADRGTDSAFKSLTARAFYGLMRLQGVPIIPNHADYRLMSAKALEVLGEFTEGNLFLRGVIAQEIGLKSSQVIFDVRDRAAGATKYSLRRMLSFALNGITSFSVAPLRLVTAVGIVFTMFSMLMAGYVTIQALVLDRAVPGWASTVLPIYVIGGVQLTSIGIIGEYVGRIYREVKRRPRFIIEEQLGD